MPQRKIAFIIGTFFIFSISICFGQTGIITTVVGNGVSGFSGDGGSAVLASLASPHHVAFDTAGNMYIADYYNLRVRKVNAEGVITTIVGSGITGYSGDGGPAIYAAMRTVDGVAVDNLMNIYIADEVNHNVRKVNSSGIISTLIPANYPLQLTTDIKNNVYVAVNADNSIRKVDTAGISSTFAGSGAGGFSGDGGPATAAAIYAPAAVCFDKIGNAYIADYNNERIRKVDTFGIITTFAGNGAGGFSGDGGPATAASFAGPSDVAADDSGNVYIADQMNNRIRKVNSSGIITTVAGNGTAGFSGDGGPAYCSELNRPMGVNVDKQGNLYVADQYNNRIRKISFHPDHVTDSLYLSINKLCAGPSIVITTSSYSPSLIMKTWFGDDSTLISSPTSCGTNGVFDISHAYQVSGTYTIKHILFNGSARIDSIQYSYEYLLCNNYTLKFYNDYNGDCIKEDSEPFSMFPILVEVDSNSIPIDTVSGISGVYYTAFGNSGDIYSFKILNSPPGLYTSCPLSGIINDTIQSGMFNNQTKYFGLSCMTGTEFDVAEYASMRTGRHMASGTILVNNSYCNPKSTTVTMQFSPKYVFESAYPVPASVIGNTITWNLGPIASDLTAPPLIGFTLSVPTPGITSTWLTPGDTVNSMMIASPVIGDVDTSSNVIIRNDTVKSSYDPNKLSVSPEAFVLPGMELLYTIDFENTGNDTAINIYVMDTLSDNVDPSSLRLIAASSTMNIALITSDGHTIAKFDFPNIKLLDSSHHDQCNGMVIFKIKTKPGLTDGTAIFNHAGIFFDDNSVVMTDTVENLISLITGASALCVGSNSTLIESVVGGVWSCSNSNATISTGIVAGVSPGIDTVSYTVTNGVGTTFTTKVVTINPLPNAGMIIGTNTLCEASTTILTDSVLIGIWSDGTPSVATVNSFGTVTGINPGVAAISYTQTNSCGSTSVIIYVTVNPLPHAGYTDTGTQTVGFDYTGISTGIDSIKWDFGDESKSISTNPVHTYSVSGLYHVCVTVYTNCGIDSACGNITVVVTSTGIASFPTAKVQVLPNPTSGDLYITGVPQVISYQLLNVSGAAILEGILDIGSNSISMKNFASGVYILEMIETNGTRNIVRVVKE